ncbi:hypothetical protein KVT40_004015 [Elsinoe batatas]|uniref:Uncharacterized protein n=1 Tax=Elsinoe batatas TaxID=2601811 RepID=A0A8K0PH35_9PEZI|nr:hypothetical protein KVT40_004015 [Elsinoe batatas]
MSSGVGIREKLRRKLSLHDKNSNFDDHDEADDETTGNLHREIEEAETGNHNEGKPGSFLNRLISHGNKKTEDQLMREARGSQSQPQ